MNAQASKSGTHIDPARLLLRWQTGALMEARLEAHLARCADCQVLEQATLLTALGAVADHPTHRHHRRRMSEERLTAWLRDELEPDEAREVEANVRRCDACRFMAGLSLPDLEAFGIEPHPARAALVRPAGLEARELLDEQVRGPVAGAAAGAAESPEAPLEEAALEDRTAAVGVDGAARTDSRGEAGSRWEGLLSGLRAWWRQPLTWGPTVALATSVALMIAMHPYFRERFGAHDLPGGSGWQEKASVGRREVQLQADILTTGADGRTAVVGKLASEGTAQAECLAGRSLRFRVQATGQGHLALWRVRSATVELQARYSARPFGGVRFPLNGPDGGRLVVSVGLEPGRVRYVLTLTDEPAPPQGVERWLEELRDSPRGGHEVAEVSCTIPGGGQ